MVDHGHDDHFESAGQCSSDDDDATDVDERHPDFLRDWPVHVGTKVHVLSQRAGGWLPGCVAEPVHPRRFTAEFKFEGKLCRKHLRPSSESFRIHCGEGLPGSGHFSCDEASRALGRFVTVRIGRHRKMYVEALGLTHQRVTAFVAAAPLREPCLIEYQGSFDDDVCLKVYAADARIPRDVYDQYTFIGFIHAMRRPRIGVHVPWTCAYHLGLEIHRDLNRQWLWKLKTDDPGKFEAVVSRCTPGGHQGRGDVEAERTPARADYLISFSTGNKEDNDRLLRRLSAQPVEGPHGHGPITFCTDRSLGLGVHTLRGHYEDLYIGKHGFAQPVAANGWFEEYCRAAAGTRFGLLVINLSREYFQSQACRNEFYAGAIPRGRKFAYEARTHRILEYFQWQEQLTDGPLELHAAAKNGHSRVAAILGHDAASARAFDALGRTPLHYAAKHGHSDIALLLLAARAEVNAPNNAGSTPLHFAAPGGFDPLIPLLLTAKAELEARNTERGTPLHLAAIFCKLATAMQLVRASADLHAQCRLGRTALHYAAEKGQEHIVTFLLRARAELGIRDRSGATPFDLAVEGGHDSTVAQLSASCARPGE
mmetsp:Transcript_124577/g.346905  ORF Transcript_124577/g.346905 Transcript_124577/m.346905 type:complete len:595 (+) Transcript_124577:110-1894(+)